MATIRADAKILLATSLLVVAACREPAAAPPAVGVEVQPPSATLPPSGQQQFAALVTGAADTVVVWDVVEASGGTVSSGGLYSAPSSTGSFHVRATSHANPAVAGTATVTVTALPAVTVGITPTNGAVDACLTLAFHATVTGSADQAVTWSVQEGAGGGSIASNGTYTAPAAAGTYHVVATSHADASAQASVPVVVSDKVLAVDVSPTSTALHPGETAQFHATVTTTCGAFVTTRVLRAPE